MDRAHPPPAPYLYEGDHGYNDPNLAGGYFWVGGNSPIFVGGNITVAPYVSGFRDPNYRNWRLGILVTPAVSVGTPGAGASGGLLISNAGSGNDLTGKGQTGTVTLPLPPASGEASYSGSGDLWTGSAGLGTPTKFPGFTYSYGYTVDSSVSVGEVIDAAEETKKNIQPYLGERPYRPWIRDALSAITGTKMPGVGF